MEGDAEPWWDDEPGLMALYPLCHHGEGAEAAIRHAASAIERTVTEQSVRQDFLAFLGFYGKLGYPTADVLGIIGRENMRDSAFYQEVFADGVVEARRAAHHLVSSALDSRSHRPMTWPRPWVR